MTTLHEPVLEKAAQQKSATEVSLNGPRQQQPPEPSDHLSRFSREFNEATSSGPSSLSSASSFQSLSTTLSCKSSSGISVDSAPGSPDKNFDSSYVNVDIPDLDDLINACANIDLNSTTKQQPNVDRANSPTRSDSSGDLSQNQTFESAADDTIADQTQILVEDTIIQTFKTCPDLEVISQATQVTVASEESLFKAPAPVDQSSTIPYVSFEESVLRKGQTETDEVAFKSALTSFKVDVSTLSRRSCSPTPCEEIDVIVADSSVESTEVHEQTEQQSVTSEESSSIATFEEIETLDSTVILGPESCFEDSSILVAKDLNNLNSTVWKTTENLSREEVINEIHEDTSIKNEIAVPKVNEDIVSPTAEVIVQQEVNISQEKQIIVQKEENLKDSNIIVQEPLSQNKIEIIKEEVNNLNKTQDIVHEENVINKNQVISQEVNNLNKTQDIVHEDNVINNKNQVILQEVNNLNKTQDIVHEDNVINNKNQVILQEVNNLNKTQDIVHEDNVINNKNQVILQEVNNLNKTQEIVCEENVINKNQVVLQEVNNLNKTQDIVHEENDLNKNQIVSQEVNNLNKTQDVVNEENILNKSQVILNEENKLNKNEAIAQEAKPQSKNEVVQENNDALIHRQNIEQEINNINATNIIVQSDIQSLNKPDIYVKEESRVSSSEVHSEQFLKPSPDLVIANTNKLEESQKKSTQFVKNENFVTDPTRNIDSLNAGVVASTPLPDKNLNKGDHSKSPRRKSALFQEPKSPRPQNSPVLQSARSQIKSEFEEAFEETLALNNSIDINQWNVSDIAENLKHELIGQALESAPFNNYIPDNPPEYEAFKPFKQSTTLPFPKSSDFQVVQDAALSIARNIDASLEKIEESEHFVSATTELFGDPCALDFLNQLGSQPTRRGERYDSLYMKFDPLAPRLSMLPQKNVPVSPSADEEENKETKADAPISNMGTPKKNPALAAIDRLLFYSPCSPSSAETEAAEAKQKKQEEAEKVPGPPAVAVPVVDEKMAKELELVRSTVLQLEAELEKQKVAFEDRVSHMQTKFSQMQSQLTQEVKCKDQMTVVVEEYEKSISRLIAEREKDRTSFETEKAKLQEELQVANQHLSNTEAAFSDVHSKYERLKNVVSAYKSNETVLKESIAENQETIKTLENRYEQLKSHAMAQLEKANLELSAIRKHHEAETMKLKAQCRKAELKSKSLEETVEQKMKENKELTQIIDEMIARVD